MAEEKNVKAELVEDVEQVDAELVDENDTLVLTEPMPNGKTELVFNFKKINGYTLIKCEKVAKKQDPGMLVPSLSMVFQATVAAAAAGVRYDDILSLGATDFTAACVKAQAFLLNAGK